MKYLVRKTKAKVAHLWDGRDTVCRMHSTLGLASNRYEVRMGRGQLQICHLCKSRKSSRTSDEGHLQSSKHVVIQGEVKKKRRRKVIDSEELGVRRRLTLSCGHVDEYVTYGVPVPKTRRCRLCEQVPAKAKIPKKIRDKRFAAYSKKKREEWAYFAESDDFPTHDGSGRAYCFHESRWGSRKHSDVSPSVSGKILDGGTYVCIGNQIIPKNWPNFDSLVAFLTQ